jgi:RNA polymerase sigma-70 factor (ECF subfamily)
MNHLSDEHLIGQVKQANTAAFQALYDRHGSYVLGFCIKILNDQAQAEEVLQETFWRIWDSANTFDEKRGSFQS